MDDWTNARGESILNFMVVTPKPICCNVVEIEDHRGTGYYISGDISKVVQKELETEKVFALVTDNTCNMKAAWTIVSQNIPRITTLACRAHGLNLLLSGLLKLVAS